MTGHKPPKGPSTIYLPDGWNKPVPRPAPMPCKRTCCWSPFGHATGRDVGVVDSLRCKCHDDQKESYR